MDHLKLTFDKLPVESISEKVVDNSCGAVSVFIGTTRDNFEGKKVVKLEYEAYEPMALKAMKCICDEIRTKWPAVHGIAIYHSCKDIDIDLILTESKYFYDLQVVISDLGSSASVILCLNNALVPQDIDIMIRTMFVK